MPNKDKSSWLFPITVYCTGMWNDAEGSPEMDYWDANFNIIDATGEVVSSGGVCGYSYKAVMALGEDKTYSSLEEYNAANMQ